MQTLGTTSTGLSAIEYLIFGSNHGDTNSVITSFKAKGSRRAAYLRALSLDLKDQSDQLIYQWSIGGGNYLNNFLASDGNGRGSSIGVLTDNMITMIARIKDDRIGAPYGTNNNGTARPDLVESKFSGQSIAFVRAELQSIQQVFTGLRTENIGANGFDWLLDKTDAKSGEVKLSAAITAQFVDIYFKLELLKTPLEQAVVTNTKQVADIYAAIVQLQILIRDDMVAGLD
jgi:predicted lipoprotein